MLAISAVHWSPKDALSIIWLSGLGLVFRITIWGILAGGDELVKRGSVVSPFKGHIVFYGAIPLGT